MGWDFCPLTLGHRLSSLIATEMAGGGRSSIHPLNLHPLMGGGAGADACRITSTFPLGSRLHDVRARLEQSFFVSVLCRHAYSSPLWTVWVCHDVSLIARCARGCCAYRSRA